MHADPLASSSSSSSGSGCPSNPTDPASASASAPSTTTPPSIALSPLPAPHPRLHPDPHKWQAAVTFAVFMLTLPCILAFVAAVQPPAPVHPWAEAAERLNVEPAFIALGESTYRNACTTCHGPEGQGVPRLGKPIRNSAFVQEADDATLFRLLAEGRGPTDPANTTGALMPARGAQGLADDDLRAVIAYMRAIQDPDQPLADVTPWNTARPATNLTIAAPAPSTAPDQPVAPAEVAASAPTAAPPTNAPELAAAQRLFDASCAACHGTGGVGIEGLGKPLASSQWVKAQTDKDLITFIKTGRPIWDAENTTGLDMPPKGGNPALSDEQLTSIVQYIRSL